MFRTASSYVLCHLLYCACQTEVSAAAAGDSLNNVLYRHKAAVHIQRWFRLLVRKRHNGQASPSHQAEISANQQCVRQMLDAKRQELLRQRQNTSSSVSDNGEEKDWERRKKEKARLARQEAIQVTACNHLVYLSYFYSTLLFHVYVMLYYITFH